MAKRDTFVGIRTEGAILPSDILQRIASGDGIDGLDPVAYHLARGERLGEAVTRSWNRLAGLWAAFRDGRSKASENDPATTLTREGFLLPLFQELGYGRLQVSKTVEIDGKTYPVSHSWSSVPVHLVGFKVDLDLRTKGVAGAATHSPHALVQELLNRSPERLYGLVSNGLVLRILRDNNSLTRQAYVEFDIAGIFDNDLYQDFFLLWLVCHESRFEGDPPEDCWLERWSKQAATEGTRALDDLRKGVEDAILALGRGFLSEPSNSALKDSLRAGTLTTNDYYRQVLRCVYRLLFLFAAEDRELLLDPGSNPASQERYLRFYSTGRLREMAEKMRGTRHTDLYAMLKLVFFALGSDEGAPALGLPPLGSFLWSQETMPDLEAGTLANADLLEGIRALAFVTKGGLRRSIDYRNLGSEELGSVYESLLELHPEVQIDATSKEDRFRLGTATGHERRTTGSYYTPRELVAALCDSALEPICDEAIRSEDPESAILDLKICDPAAGSGHFLIAAAHRIARRLAAVRSGDEEPPPPEVRRALRDVIGSCIYGVDVNPMAVELCKVSLWMEALDPGKPLSFLDAHIKMGNSLIGATPDLIASGIPDDAFSPITGDEKDHVTRLKKRNRDERKMEESGNIQLAIAESPLAISARALADSARKLEALSDEAPEDIAAKERAHAEILTSDPYVQGKLLADAWCAAFYQTKTKEGPLQITQETVRLLSETPSAISAAERDAISTIAMENGFFHWHLEFPAVFANGASGRGFDVVLANPPWEQTQLSEKEFFAALAPDIAAKAGASRKEVIARLATDDPALYEQFQSALRKAEAESHFLRHSARYPLCGKGTINSYAVFAETMRYIAGASGRVGCIVPTGIATDNSTKDFFADCVKSKALASLFEFKNKGFFPAVGNLPGNRFCLLTLSGSSLHDLPEFFFHGEHLAELADPERRFTLSPDDFSLLNPNTLTCPIFRSRRDAEITKAIYGRMPVLVDESKGAAGNRWGVSFRQGLFNMTSDSELFRTREQLEADGWTLVGSVFRKTDAEYVPLYEAKMVDLYDHRFGDYALAPPTEKQIRQLPQAPLEQLNDPGYVPLPRYWVPVLEVDKRLAGNWDRGWLLGWRDVTDARASERTLIAAVIPRAGVANNFPLMITRKTTQLALASACLSSFALDFVSRQKTGGTHMNFFIYQQLPIFAPDGFPQPTPWAPASSLDDWLAPRVLELTYTAWDLQAFAHELGYDGPPFRWDPERRFLLRCELDAAFFHLYAISVDDADYIMDTFPIVNRRDEAAHGEHRTKNSILEIFDAMVKAMDTGEPYRTVLEPPPADPSIAHSPRRDRESMPGKN